MMYFWELPGFDKEANILAQGSDGVVLEEPTTHAIAIVQKSQDGAALASLLSGLD